jgi:hypothetical protein
MGVTEGIDGRAIVGDGGKVYAFRKTVGSSQILGFLIMVGNPSPPVS